jgi:hypothetical protein
MSNISVYKVMLTQDIKTVCWYVTNVSRVCDIKKFDAMPTGFSVCFGLISEQTEIFFPTQHLLIVFHNRECSYWQWGTNWILKNNPPSIHSSRVYMSYFVMSCGYCKITFLESNCIALDYTQNSTVIAFIFWSNTFFENFDYWALLQLKNWK